MAKTNLKSTRIDDTLEVVGDIFGEKITTSEARGQKYDTLSDRLEGTELEVTNVQELAGEIIEEAGNMREDFEQTKKEIGDSISVANEAIDALCQDLGEVEERVEVLENHHHDTIYSKLGHKHSVLDLTDLDLSHNHDDKYALIRHKHTLADLPHNHDETYSLKEHGHSDLAKKSHKHSVGDLTDLDLSHNHDERYSKVDHNHDADYSRVTHRHDDRYSKLAHEHDDSYSALNHKHDSDYSKLQHKHSVIDLTDLDLSHDHDDVYAFKVHEHSIVEVDGLQSNLEDLEGRIETLENNNTPPEHTHDEYALKEETYSKEEVDGLLENIETTPKDHEHDQYVKKDTVASKETLGLVKIGKGLHISDEGVLECTNIGSNGESGGTRSFTINESDWIYKVDAKEYYYTKPHDLSSTDLIMAFYDEQNYEVKDVGVQLLDQDTVKIFRGNNAVLRVVMSLGGAGGSINSEDGKFTKLTSDILIIKDVEGDYAQIFVNADNSLFAKPAYLKLGKCAIGYSRLR